MIDAEGGVSEVVQADVSEEESCKSAVARTVQLFGTVHILVNIGESLLSTMTFCCTILG
jgi:NAD(P)-dependent dehydrogenase (short-subunit alcohol dehydrogenase family)